MAARRRKTTKKRPTQSRNAAPKPPTAGWWGDGPPPWERWPDVSLELEATWCAERERWESPCGDYYFDPEAASRPGDFFRHYLRHSKGEYAGQPLVPLDWQQLLVLMPLFGWLRVADGYRRFRTLFLLVAKKNGKSLITSGLGLYLLCADQEPGAEVYAAAANEEQARIVFGESSEMVDSSPELAEDAGLIVMKRSITHPESSSTYKVLSKAVGTKHGFNVHGLLFDEFHTQKTRDLYDVLYRGISARRQPVVAIISTAGSDRQSICYEMREHALEVLAGRRRDERLLPVIFEIAPADDWTDEETWHKANPSLGVGKSIEYMRDECELAQAEPRRRNSFLNLELNVWTESRVAWIPPERFQVLARTDVAREAEPSWLRGLPCVAGLDLSMTTDLTACVLAFKQSDDQPAEEVEVETEESDRPRVVYVDYRVHLVESYWIPRERMQDRCRRDRVPYDLWARQGWINVTSGAVVDYAEIYAHVLAAMDRYAPREVAIDPWNATDLSQRMMADGVPIVHVRQGYGSLSAPSKLFEALIASGRLTYSGSPVTLWCVQNAQIDHDPSGNIKPCKPDPKGARRIDGVSAAVTALSRLMVLPRRRVFSTRDLLG